MKGNGKMDIKMEVLIIKTNSQMKCMLENLILEKSQEKEDLYIQMEVFILDKY